MTDGKLVKIDDREVSETEAFLRDMADDCARSGLLDSVDLVEIAPELTKAADEFAALEQDLRAALQTIRERTAERDAAMRIVHAAVDWRYLDRDEDTQELEDAVEGWIGLVSKQ